MKRSSQVALLMMGTVSVGGAAYALMPSERCDPNQSGITQPAGQPPANCSHRSSWHSSSSSGSSGYRSSSGSSSSQSFFGGSSSSGTSSAVDRGSSSSSSVARGGFGSFASHFSGGS